MCFSILTYVVSEFIGAYPHDIQRIGQEILVIVSAVALTSSVLPTVRTILSVLAAVTFAWFTGGRWGVIEVLHLTALILLGGAWAARLRRVPEPSLLRNVVLLTVLYVGLLLPRWFALVFEQLSFHPQEFFTGFSNQRFFGHWVTMTLPLLVLARLRVSASGRKAWGLDALAGLWVCFSVASGTRGTWAAVAAVMVMLLLSGHVARRLSLGIVRAVLIGGFLYSAMFVLMPWLLMDEVAFVGVSRLADGASLSGRNVLWTMAWQGIRAHPFSGAGPMAFARTPNAIAAHPHNTLLQLAYEWGVPIATVVVALATWWLWRQWQIGRREADLLRVALVAGIVGALLQSLVDGNLVMPFSQSLFVLQCAWLASLDSVPKESVGLECKRGVTVGALRIFMMGVALLQALLTEPEWSRLSAWEKQGLAHTGIDIYQPRYWIQGVVPAAPAPLSLP